MPTFCVGSPAKVDSGTGIVQEKYLTITVPKKNIEEARSYFTRIGADLAAHYAALGSKCVELDATERLRILHDFYRQGEEADFHFSIRDMMKKGHDFRDYINPEGEFAPMVQAMGDDVGTVIHVTAGGKDRLNLSLIHI